jgi:capsular polysaccharide biosynthesis protein
MHGSRAFGHAIFDFLPAILTFEDKIKANELKIVVGSKCPKWFFEILSVWRLLPHHFLVLPEDMALSYQFRSAIISNSLTTFTTFYPHAKTMDLFDAKSPAKSRAEPVRASGRYLYLHRKPETMNSGRTIANEDDVVKAMSDRGFLVIDPATRPFAEQVELFRNAELIVGAHGSAFANLVWCGPGTKIIDLMPDDWVDFWGSGAGTTELWIHRIAAVRGLHYHVLLCNSQGSTQKWIQQKNYRMTSFVDLPQLTKKIDELLQPVSSV